MRGGIGSDPEVAEVIEGVRRRLFDTFVKDVPFASVLAKQPKFHIAVRGWIGFVEGASIDWCADPSVSRVELRELLTQILFEIMKAVAPSIAAKL